VADELAEGGIGVPGCVEPDCALPAGGVALLAPAGGGVGAGWVGDGAGWGVVVPDPWGLPPEVCAVAGATMRGGPPRTAHPVSHRCLMSFTPLLRTEGLGPASQRSKAHATGAQTHSVVETTG